MPKAIVIILVVALLLAGCAAPTPDPAVIEQIVRDTLEAVPTQTPYATHTAMPTYTPYPTYTKAPTQTPKVIVVTPTNTATPTLTPTPINSPTPTFQPWQQTQEVYKATQAFYAQYEAVPYKDFLTYPYNFEGEKVSLKCRIFNIVDSWELQCYFPYTYDAYYVMMDKKYESLYEGDHITVYGVGDGEECFKNSYGGSVCQPLVNKAFYTKP